MSNVIHKGLVVALCDDADLADAAVNHSGKLEVDQTVATAVRHGTHGANRRYLAEIIIVCI